MTQVRSLPTVTSFNKAIYDTSTQVVSAEIQKTGKSVRCGVSLIPPFCILSFLVVSEEYVAHSYADSHGNCRYLISGNLDAFAALGNCIFLP